MGVDQAMITGAQAGQDPESRGFRAFGLLRRREGAEPATGERLEESRPELRYTLDPDVARRIARYVGQEPRDTDLAQILAS
jgi:hypothetical protein